MFQVYTCLTGDHDWRLVLLAAAICLLASAVAISLFHRAQSTTGRTQFLWLGLNATAAGCGIWATHFIAMLAYAPAVHAGYDLTLTILSLLIAILITGAGLGLAVLSVGRLTPALGGAIAGGGIAAMHYAGMAALELPGRITWSTGLVTASIVFGIVFGALAIHCAARRDTWPTTLTAIGLLTLAIVSMHFTAMGAVQAIPDTARDIDSLALSPAVFSIVVANTTAIILGMCLVAALSDQRSENKLRRQKDLLDAALENMSQGLCMFDAEGRVRLFNHRYGEMTGLPAASIEGQTLLQLFHKRKKAGNFAADPEKFFADVLEGIRSHKINTRTIEFRDRTLRVVEAPMQNGGWIATLEDITEGLIAQAKITHMAHHDALTDLANRTKLVKKLEEALAALRSRDCSFAVHFMDLDRFKKINDTLGHDAGDFLLKTIAERLRSIVREDDVVARLGGDEFVVVQTGVRDADMAREFAQRLITGVTAPIKLNEQTMVATVSVGVALAPADGTDPERILKSADLALYKAKADGRNCIRFFESDMDAELQERTKLEKMMREAITNDGFELHYQPLFEMNERRLIGFEALIRLPSADGTLIQPMEFIPLAEELQIIDKIGAWVLREACRTAATWPDDMTVAVNLSPAQFEAGNVSDIVANALKSAGLAPHRLELEITESLLLGDSAATMNELWKIKEMGVAIVMDDFGTGYSSLSYLWKFPFDKIKIDRSFMHGLDDAGRDAHTVIKTIIALGRELNMRVTVEGVETAKQATFLDDSAGDQAQGFYFGRPVPAAEVSANILAAFQKRRRVPACGSTAPLRIVKPAS